MWFRINRSYKFQSFQVGVSGYPKVIENNEFAVSTY